MSYLPDQLNQAEFAQKCLNTASSQFAEAIRSGGYDTCFEIDAAQDMVDELNDSSVLIGQPVVISFRDLGDQLPSASLKSYSSAEEDHIGSGICTGIVSGFSIGLAGNIDESAPLPGDFCLNICLYPLGISVPEDYSDYQCEIPLATIEDVQFADNDHPLKPDQDLFDDSVGKLIKVLGDQADGSPRRLSPSLVEGSVGSLNLRSRMLGRQVLLAVEHDFVVVEYVEDGASARQTASLPRLALYDGTLMGYKYADESEVTNNGQLSNNLVAVLEDSGGAEGITEIELDRIITGSLVGERLEEQDQSLFLKMQLQFYDAMADFLRTKPSRAQADEFATSLCEHIFESQYLITNNVLTIQIDPHDFYEIIRGEVIDGVLTVTPNPEVISEDDKLRVSEWHQLEAGLAGFNHSISVEAGEELELVDFTFELMLRPFDELAESRQAQLLRLPVDCVQTARLSVVSALLS